MSGRLIDLQARRFHHLVATDRKLTLVQEYTNE